MHTAEELEAPDFEYLSDGKPVSRSDVMPTIAPEDRVGVVMGTGTDGIAAGNFILSCVTAFYDHLREAKGDFFEYPDYYTFQTTEDAADYGMLDIYPDHKNVTVEPDAEQLLRAISDRAINILLVPDVSNRRPDVDDITLRSVERRIEHCYRYAHDGRLEDPEFSIRQPRRPAGDWYETIIKSMDGIPTTEDRPWTEHSDDYITQKFRRVRLTRALSHLPTGDGA